MYLQSSSVRENESDSLALQALPDHDLPHLLQHPDQPPHPSLSPRFLGFEDSLSELMLLDGDACSSIVFGEEEVWSLGEEELREGGIDSKG